MHKIFSKAFAIGITTAMLLTGCGSEAASTGGSSDPGKTDSNAIALQKQLEDGRFYVRKKDKDGKWQYYPVCMGEKTFDDDDIVEAADPKRSIMYKKDYSDIPTLDQDAGDELVMCTGTEFSEDFVYERFEDTGYTIGLVNLVTSDSGRYYVSTDKEKANTYPGGDTDDILLFNAKDNENVILEALGGVELRTVLNDDGTVNYTFLTDYGSITGLKKDESYDADVYVGTILHKFKYKADVREFGSMQVYKTHDYEFVDKGLIKMNIPDWFNSGYYSMNAQGLFRYKKSETADASDDNLADYNVRNINPADDSGDNAAPQTPGEGEGAGSANSDYNNAFTVDDTSTQKTVHITFDIPDNTQDLNEVSGVIKSPSGTQSVEMNSDGNGGLTATFTPQETGTYKIFLYDVAVRTPHVDVQ